MSVEQTSKRLAERAVVDQVPTHVVGLARFCHPCDIGFVTGPGCLEGREKGKRTAQE